MPRFALWALATLERWFLRHVVRFVGAGLLISMGWSAAVAAVTRAFEVERVVAPVLGARPVEQTMVHVLVAAPLIENAVLWLLYRVAAFAMMQWRPAHAGALAVGLSSVTFTLAHAPFKQAYGLEVLALAWLIAMCFLWGDRHRQPWRGVGVSVALHVALNAAAVGMYYR
jgi:hypothetical protein